MSQSFPENLQKIVDEGGEVLTFPHLILARTDKNSCTWLLYDLNGNSTDLLDHITFKEK